MSMFGWNTGNVVAISQLAAKVYAAYKDAPDEYRHISERVISLQVIINTAVQHSESTTLNEHYLEEGQEVLQGCRGILEDLNSLTEKLAWLEKYNSLASANTRLIRKRIMLGTEDITILRQRLISNTVLLQGFIQRYGVSTINSKYIMLISPF